MEVSRSRRRFLQGVLTGAAAVGIGGSATLGALWAKSQPTYRAQIVGRITHAELPSRGDGSVTIRIERVPTQIDISGSDRSLLAGDQPTLRVRREMFEALASRSTGLVTLDIHSSETSVPGDITINLNRYELIIDRIVPQETPAFGVTISVVPNNNK